MTERHCGVTLGHGLTCQPGFQCDNCRQIDQLYEENEKLKDVLRFLQKQAQAGVDELKTKTYSDPTTERLRQKAIDTFQKRVKYFEGFLT